MLTKSRAIICADCGETFDSEAPNIKYCLKCRLNRFRPRNPVDTKTCICGCGREFSTTRPWQIFFSNGCRNAYHRQKYEEIIKYGRIIKV